METAVTASAIGDLAARERDATFTKSSSNMRTYQFRAPEAFLKNGAYSYPSDVWSAGVNILYMHLGSVPFW